MRFDLYDRSGGEAPSSRPRASSLVPLLYSARWTTSPRSPFASVAPALGQVESHCTELADVHLDICDGPERAQVDDRKRCAKRRLTPAALSSS
ncbi:hypothetical protein [Sorangium sp. So ce145]|uniref:hypothetical protein n=1 Tax=Sorangium sp. So ce145 TaxID=3133285 RepID=UPI003F5F4EF1